MSLAQKSFVTAAVAPFLLAFGLAASDAQAGDLISGHCYAKADAEAALKREGHVPIIIGERTAFVPVTAKNPSGLEENANVFFMNKQGYGYNIEGDRPLGVTSQTLCVRASYKDGHLNNPNSPEIPSWGKNIKAVGNIDLVKAYQKGARLLMAAQTYTLQNDGTEKSGKYITVLMDTQDKDSTGVVWAINSAGYPDTNFLMEKTGITKKMEEMLGVNTAATQP
jgi:hypothetical protein